MDSSLDHDDREWPPGTVRIEDMYHGSEIIQQPRPTSDPNDPLNWTKWRKYLNFSLACLYSLFVWADVNVVTVTWGLMNEGVDLKNGNGFSYELLNDSYAAGCAALAVGSPLLIPFALKYGRRPIYLVSTLAQFAIAVWTAKLQTKGDLVAVNTLNCLFGALAEVIVQMTVADVFFVHERGRMNSLYQWAISLSLLATIAGGYICESQGWRWVWWWMAIFFGISFIIYAFLFEESKFTHVHDGIDPAALQDPVLLDAMTSETTTTTTTTATTEKKEPASESKAPDTEVSADLAHYSHDVKIDRTIPLKSYRDRLTLWTTSAGSLRSLFRHSYQPMLIFATIPSVFYFAVVYSVTGATATVITTVLSEYLYYPPYNFTTAGVGLMSLPAFIGGSLGLLICGPLSDWGILYQAKRNKGIYEPEMRLWIIAAFIPFQTAGLLLFGFGLANGNSWPVIAVSTGLQFFGTAPANSIALTYLTDSYTDIIADSMVGITVVRNLVSLTFVFSISPWVDGMGLKNVFIMLAVLNTVILLSLVVFIYWGKGFRTRTAKTYRYYSQRQLDSRTM